MNQIALDLQPSEPEYRTIPLTRGQFAIVDAADFDWLMQWKWQAHFKKSNETFYARRSSSPDESGRRKTIHMHRLIMDAASDVQVDHKDRNTLNCRRNNLRIATPSQNKCNQKLRKDNSSGFKGAKPHPNGTWQARAMVNGKRVSLGYHLTPQLAHEAHMRAIREMHGEFASEG